MWASRRLVQALWAACCPQGGMSTGSFGRAQRGRQLLPACGPAMLVGSEPEEGDGPPPRRLPRSAGGGLLSSVLIVGVATTEVEGMLAGGVGPGLPKEPCCPRCGGELRGSRLWWLAQELGALAPRAPPADRPLAALVRACEAAHGAAAWRLGQAGLPDRWVLLVVLAGEGLLSHRRSLFPAAPSAGTIA